MEGNRNSNLLLILMLLAGMLLGMFVIRHGDGFNRNKVVLDSGVGKFDEVMWHVQNDYVDTVNRF